MSAPAEGSLTQLALSIQADNKRFQEELTAATLQASQDPESSLDRLNQCEAESSSLERRELEFLAKMGDFGTQQSAVAKDTWRETRLQIMVGKAQVLILLGRYDQSQCVIDSARAYVSGPADPASLILDQLELSVLQARS